MNIEVGVDDCTSLFAIAKEEYVLGSYRPKPEASGNDRMWLQRFKQFAKAARTSLPPEDMEQWPEFRVSASDQGYVIATTPEVAEAISRAIRAVLVALDETDVHARTGESKAHYEALVGRVFGR